MLRMLTQQQINPVFLSREGSISKLNNLEFRSSYDDLDFLVFALLPLHSNIRVALVSYQNAPIPSIEICVRHDLQNVGDAIAQALDRLNLTPKDLTWIDPQYDRELSNLIKDQSVVL